MNYQGVLTKMTTELSSTVQYYLLFEQDFLHMNQLLDKRISINFLRFQCMNCKSQKKIFRSGHCYNCHSSMPELGDWIIRPELSKAHLGVEDRNLDYEKQVQLAPHVVYLANSSNVKVGVTRKSQVPTRWIDQGAHEAVAVVEVPNRYLAGITEVALMKHVSDKTNWRQMLCNDLKSLDLLEIKYSLKEHLPEEVRKYYLENNQGMSITYPVLQYPQAVKSFNLIKTPFYEGVLKGIKGQYLIFEDGHAFNVRSHEGYEVQLCVK